MSLLVGAALLTTGSSCSGSKKRPQPTQKLALDHDAAAALAKAVVRSVQSGRQEDFEKLGPTQKALDKMAKAVGRPAPSVEVFREKSRLAFTSLRENEYVTKIDLGMARFTKMQTPCKRVLDGASICDARSRVTDGKVTFDLIMTHCLVTSEGVYLGSKPVVVGIN